MTQTDPQSQTSSRRGAAQGELPPGPALPFAWWWFLSFSHRVPRSIISMADVYAEMKSLCPSSMTPIAPEIAARCWMPVAENQGSKTG